MLKTGKYRALRNMPIGWFLQAIHSTDFTERIFRILIEFFILLFFYFVVMLSGLLKLNFTNLVLLFIFVHTVVFLLSGNFQVYLLDSFRWVKNPGIVKILEYIKISRKFFCMFDSCDAILVYGSMCRCQFHIRSDLDLRIIRRTGSLRGLLALPIGYLLRTYALFAWVPVDLQVVDSLGFINKQMRGDEKPIVVYRRSGVEIPNTGMDFYKIELDPSYVLKKQESNK